MDSWFGTKVVTKIVSAIFQNFFVCTLGRWIYSWFLNAKNAYFNVGLSRLQNKNQMWTKKVSRIWIFWQLKNIILSSLLSGQFDKNQIMSFLVFLLVQLLNSWCWLCCYKSSFLTVENDFWLQVREMTHVLARVFHPILIQNLEIIFKSETPFISNPNIQKQNFKIQNMRTLPKHASNFRDHTNKNFAKSFFFREPQKID